VVYSQDEIASMRRELQERVALSARKTRVFPLPEGNSYCLYCGALCFVVPEKDNPTEPATFCPECTKMQEAELI
jgi:hypothetical protein